MNITQLRCFQQVFREGSIHKASQSLYTSQQAVSKMILNLEKELGVRLFERSSQGVIPTENGILLMRETRDLIEQLDAVAYRIKSANLKVKGSVHFGALIGQIGILSRMNIRVLEQCAEIYPEIEIAHENLPPKDIEEALKKGDLEFGFSAFPDEPLQLTCHKLYDFKWYLAMGHDHPLASRACLEIRDLSDQALIFPKDEQFDRQQIIRALSDRKPPRFIDASADLYDTILQQLLPQKALLLCAEPHAPILNPALIRLVPLKTDLLRSQVYLLMKKDVKLSEASRQVLTYLLKAWQFPLPKKLEE